MIVYEIEDEYKSADRLRLSLNSDGTVYVEAIDGNGNAFLAVSLDSLRHVVNEGLAKDEERRNG